MRSMIRNLFFLLIISLFYLHLPVIQSHAGDVNVLNVAMYHTAIATLDPHVQNTTERYICLMTYEPLITRYRDTMELVPKLATSWKVSEDAKAFTFFLRKGVKFQDGTPFNADAVKFNFDRINYLKKGFYWMLSLLERVEVVDEYTVRFILKEGFVPFLSVMVYFPMVSPKSVLDHEEKKRDFAEKWYLDHGVGTGPYRFVEFQHGVKVVHEKYDGYWGGWDRKHCSKVVTWIIPEAGTQRMMLEKGDLDLIENFTIDDFIKAKENPNLAPLEKDSMATMYIRLNYVAGPTKNLKVRQAISYCFDRKLYEKLSGGRIQEPDGPCPKDLLEGWRPQNVILEYNPEKAKKLLAEAGYPSGFEMSVIAQKGNKTTEDIAAVWQAGLAKAGAKLNIKVLTWPTIISTLNKWAIDRNPATAENAYIQNMSPKFSDPYSVLYMMYHSTAQTGQGRNWMLYSNTTADELVEKAAKIVDKKERMEIYKKAVQIITDDCPDIFVDKTIDRVITRKILRGYYFDPTMTKAIPFEDLYKVGP